MDTVYRPEGNGFSYHHYGTHISVVFDQKEEIFAFQSASDAPAEFTVSNTRIGRMGSNLEAGWDENGNGTIEDSEITNRSDVH